MRLQVPVAAIARRTRVGGRAVGDDLWIAPLFRLAPVLPVDDVGVNTVYIDSGGKVGGTGLGR